VQLHDELLEREHDLHDVFLDARNRRELVKHVLDVHAGDGRTGNRRQQNAPERIAEGDAESSLERLDHELAVRARDLGLEFGCDLHVDLLAAQRE